MDVCVQRLFFRVKHLRYGLCQGFDCWWQMCTGRATDEPTAAKTSNINVTAGDCLSTWQAEKNWLCVLGSHWRRQMLTEEQTVRTTRLFYLRFLGFFPFIRSRLILCESLRFFLVNNGRASARPQAINLSDSDVRSFLRYLERCLRWLKDLLTLHVSTDSQYLLVRSWVLAYMPLVTHITIRQTSYRLQPSTSYSELHKSL